MTMDMVRLTVVYSKGQSASGRFRMVATIFKGPSADLNSVTERDAGRHKVARTYCRVAYSHNNILY